MVSFPFPVGVVMAVDLWRRNYQDIKRVCVCVFLTSFFSVMCCGQCTSVQDGTERFWLYVLF